MFCPKCGLYVAESSLLRRNVRFMVDVAVEYDARCPYCCSEIGRMFWGRFTVSPELAEARFDDLPEAEQPESLIPPPPEMRTVLRPHRNPGKPDPGPQPQEGAGGDNPGGAAGAESAREEAGEAGEGPAFGLTPHGRQERVCPHCGRPWPETSP